MCAHAVSVAVKKLEGVESVEVSLTRAVADIRLREGNRVSIAQLRQLVKNNGFTARESTVTAVGTATGPNGARAFEVSGVNEILVIASSRSDAAAVRQLTTPANGAAARFEIAGTVAPRKEGTDEIAVTSVRPRR